MTSTCVMNQVVQTHLLISKIDVNRIIQTCDSLVNNQNKTVNQLISLFCKISVCDSYCQQIVLLCNQILSYTVTSSKSVVNVCKSLKPIDLLPDEADTYLVVDHGKGSESLTSVEHSNQIAKETFLCQNNVSPSILKPPVERSKHKPSISKRSKPQITIATSKPNITIPTSEPELPILTNSPELHIATSQPKLPIDTSHPEIIIEIGQPELLVPIATSQPKPSKPNIIETGQPELPITTSQSKSSILTRSKSNITIATSEPEIPTSTSNSELTSKPKLPITISKSECLKIINNLKLHPPSSHGKLPLATSLLKSHIATSKPEILKATSKSKFAFLKSANPKCNIPISSVAASKSELPIVTNTPKFTIATSTNQNNSKSSTIVQTLKNATDSETIEAIDNLIQNNANLLQSHLVSNRKPLVPQSKHKVFLSDECELTKATIKPEKLKVTISNKSALPKSNNNSKCNMVTYPKSYIGPRKQRLSIVTNKLELTTGIPDVSIETNELEFPIVTKLPIATSKPDLPSSTSPFEKNLKSSTIVKSRQTNATDEDTMETINNLLERNADAGEEMLEFVDITDVYDVVSDSHVMENVPAASHELFVMESDPKSKATSKSGFSIATSSNQNNSESSINVKPTLENSDDIDTFEAINNLLQDNANLLQSHSVPESKHLVPKNLHKVFVRKDRQMLCKKFICEICGKITTTLGSLKTHKLTHLDQRPFACPHCEYRCVTKSYLKDHLKIHTGEKKNQCAICGKCFLRITNLRSHELIHTVTERNYHCDLCPSQFLDKGTLNHHKRYVHDKTIQWPCAVCGKTFSHRYSLHNHSMKHNAEERFTCEICGRKFKLRNTQLKHSKTCDGGELK